MSNNRCLLLCPAVLCCTVVQAGRISEALHTMDYSSVNESNFLTAFGSVKYGPEPFDGAFGFQGICDLVQKCCIFCIRICGRLFAKM